MCIISFTALLSLINLPILSQEDDLKCCLKHDECNQEKYRKPQPEASTLLELIDEEEDLHNFDDIIRQLELQATLKQKQFMTLFAFNDETMHDLSDGDYLKIYDKEQGLQIIKYHMIFGKIIMEDQKIVEIDTIQGNRITISYDNGKFKVNNADLFCN